MGLPYWGDGKPLYVSPDKNTLGLFYWADGAPTPVAIIRKWRKLALLDDILAKSLFDAQTVLAAVSDNIPVAVTLAEQRILGRKTGGDIAALSANEVLTILGAAPASDWLINQVF